MTGRQCHYKCITFHLSPHIHWNKSHATKLLISTRTDLPSLHKINSSQILAQWFKQSCAVSFLEVNIPEISISLLAVTISSGRAPQQSRCFQWLKQTKDSVWPSSSSAALDIATNTAPLLHVVLSKRMKNPLSETQKGEVLEYSFT